MPGSPPLSHITNTNAICDLAICNCKGSHVLRPDTGGEKSTDAPGGPNVIEVQTVVDVSTALSSISRNAGSTESAFAPRKHARSRSERRLSLEVILPVFPSGAEDGEGRSPETKARPPPLFKRGSHVGSQLNEREANFRGAIPFCSAQSSGAIFRVTAQWCGDIALARLHASFKNRIRRRNLPAQVAVQ